MSGAMSVSGAPNTFDGTSLRCCYLPAWRSWRLCTTAHSQTPHNSRYACKLTNYSKFWNTRREEGV